MARKKTTKNKKPLKIKTAKKATTRTQRLSNTIKTKTSARFTKTTKASRADKLISGKKLSKKKLDGYKKILEKMRDELVGDIKNMRGESADFDSKDVSGHVIHMADVATDMYDKEFNMGLESKDRELLQKIEEALRRIEDGTYGFCLETGKPISQARLKAIPYAQYCLEYQEELESNGYYR